METIGGIWNMAKWGMGKIGKQRNCFRKTKITPRPKPKLNRLTEITPSKPKLLHRWWELLPRDENYFAWGRNSCPNVMLVRCFDFYQCKNKINKLNRVVLFVLYLIFRASPIWGECRTRINRNIRNIIERFGICFYFLLYLRFLLAPNRGSGKRGLKNEINAVNK